MSFTDEQLKHLTAPLHSANVKSRAQAGRNLSYIEAWWAIAEANRIFGFDCWARETVDLIPLGEPRLVDGKWRVGYRAKVRVTVRTFNGESGGAEIVREGCGFGSGIDKDPDQAHESALKEAESDAMKRALMTFGNPFGLALYDKAQTNVTTARPVADYNPDNPPPGESSGGPGSRKSAAQAKRDGDNEKMKAEIAALDRDGLRDFHENFASYTAHLPHSWLDPVRDMLENRLIELNGADSVRDEAGALDEGFRRTLDSSRAGAVAGSGSQVAA